MMDQLHRETKPTVPSKQSDLEPWLRYWQVRYTLREIKGSDLLYRLADVKAFQRKIDQIRGSNEIHYYITAYDLNCEELGELSRLIGFNIYVPNLIVPLEIVEYIAPPFFDGHIRTYTGNYLNVIKPDPARLNFIDIGRGLSRQYRYNGQSNSDVTVLQHSIWMLQQAIEKGWTIEEQRQTLLHDAFEAFFGDIPKPMKLFVHTFSDLEEYWMHIMADRFKFSWPMHAKVSKLDREAIASYEWEKFVKGAERNCHVEQNLVQWFYALMYVYSGSEIVEFSGPKFNEYIDDFRTAVSLFAQNNVGNDWTDSSKTAKMFA